MNESPIAKFINMIASLDTSRVALGALVIGAIYYFLVFDDGTQITQNIQGLQAQLDVENTKRVETQKILKKEEQMKADVQVFAQKFEEIKANIPVEFTESELRSIVDQFSMENGLSTIKTGRPQSFQQNDPNQPKLVDQVRLSYTFQGSYSQIVNFIKQLTSYEKLIKIGDFSLVLAPQSGSETTTANKRRSYDLTFDVNIIGFKQSLEALGKAPPTGAAK